MNQPGLLLQSRMLEPTSLNRRWTAFKGRLERRMTIVVDAAIVRLVPRASETDALLIVRLDAIGDFILWLDAAKEFRRLFPGTRIVLAANALWADLAGRLDLFDEVWSVEVARFKRLSTYRIASLFRARRLGVRYAIQPTYSRFPLLGDVLVKASGASQRIASSGDFSNMNAHEKRIADDSYTRLLPSDPKPLMELERNAEFVTAIAGHRFRASCPIIPNLGDLPASLRIELPYLIVFPGASAAFRQWPLEKFVEAADRLAAEAGLAVVLCGSAGERALCEQVAGAMARPAINLAGRTALWEFVEIVRGARLLIGNETSAVHVAAAVGTPSVCILGGGHFGRFMPYGDLVDGTRAPRAAVHPMPCFGCNWKCTQPHPAGAPVPCIDRVAVTDVVLHGRAAMSLAVEMPDG